MSTPRLDIEVRVYFPEELAETSCASVVELILSFDLGNYSLKNKNSKWGREENYAFIDTNKFCFTVAAISKYLAKFRTSNSIFYRL